MPPITWLKRFSSLRWKLAYSYVGVTLMTVLTVEILVVLLMSWFGEQTINRWMAQSVLEQTKILAELAANPLEHGDLAELNRVLNHTEGMIIKFTTTESDSSSDAVRQANEARVVINAQGTVIGSNQPGYYAISSPFSDPDLPEAETLVTKTLTEGKARSYLMQEPPTIIAVVPITTDAGEPLGVLYNRKPGLNTTFLSPGDLLNPLLTTTLVLLPIIIPLGLVFGFVTAGGVTRRLRRLSDASRALADGDLAQRVADTSSDEVGQLIRQFNAMAEQIQTNTLQQHEMARQSQRLATLEERHRLARDLHDGVKQHLFGVNLATAAALNVLDTDQETARARLLEAAEHSRQAQAEMRALLEELRPVGLDERGLIPALTDYLETFKSRTGIETQWGAHTPLSLPLTYEHALFRIVQEALTNVTRHAQATAVTLDLHTTPDAVELRIADNGKGFDLAQVQTGRTMGLQSMQERLARLQGTLEVNTSPGAGTQILARIPHQNDQGVTND